MVTLEAAPSAQALTAHPPEQSPPTQVSHSQELWTPSGLSPSELPWGAGSSPHGAAQPHVLPPSHSAADPQPMCLNSRAYQHLHHPTNRQTRDWENLLLQPQSWLLQSTEVPPCKAPGLATHSFSGHRGAAPHQTLRLLLSPTTARLELHPSSLSQTHHHPSPSHHVHKPQLHISAHPAPPQLSKLSRSCFFPSPSLAHPSACSTRQSPGHWQWEGAVLLSELPGMLWEPQGAQPGCAQDGGR